MSKKSEKDALDLLEAMEAHFGEERFKSYDAANAFGYSNQGMRRFLAANNKRVLRSGSTLRRSVSNNLTFPHLWGFRKP